LNLLSLARAHIFSLYLLFPQALLFSRKWAWNNAFLSKMASTHLVYLKLSGFACVFILLDIWFGLLEIFPNNFSLKDKWNWHLAQVVSYFLELC